jgi:ABC-2 type transport system ATP-binding protein
VSAPARTTAAVAVVGVSKVYPRRRRDRGSAPPAVDNVDLAIEPGEIYGLLGPNGAGKSTMVRMIATLLEPTSGEIRVCGHSVVTEKRAVRARLGVALGGERSVYWKLTARQNLEFFCALHGIPRRAAPPRIMEALDRVRLSEHADEHIERWSTGMRQRLVLARALLDDPEVLLLDEPASGLDPRAADTLHEVIAGFRERGHTILLTTHDMTEADLLSDRIGVIDNGRLVGQGTPGELKAAIGGQQMVRAQVRATGAPDDLLADLRTAVRVQSRPAVATPDIVDVTLVAQGGEDLVQLLVSAAQRHEAHVLSLEQGAVTLREVFLALTGHGLGDRDA